MAPTMSVPAKVALITVLSGTALGISLLLAAYFKRRRRPKARRNYLKSENQNSYSYKSEGSEHSARVVRRFSARCDSPQQNGEVPMSRRSNSPVVPTIANGSSIGLCDSINNLDETASMSTTLTVTHTVDKSKLQPEQLCELGMEQLRVAIETWETALEKLEALEEEDEVDSPTEQLQYHISELLERAYRIQDAFESKLFSTLNTDVAISAALEEMDKEYADQKKRSLRSLRSLDDSSSDMDSFVSALSVADLTDLEDQKGTFPQYAIYEAALLELEHGCVPCRTLRTKMLHCSSDTEFLAKLHCVRIAFQELFKDEATRNYFADCNRQIITDLLVKAERDPEEFQLEYDSMMDWVKNADNWPEMETELRGRGVKLMTFYDIVMDFLILDAFDDLENPPSSVITVTQNRWLSNGFKETALSTAVWSVLKAKRRMLKHPRGFIAHFYAVSEHTSPVMAWGFLGPDTPLKDLCMIFKDQVLGFMRDVFSFQKVRYTTIEHLTEDIHKLAKERLKATMNALSVS